MDWVFLRPLQRRPYLVCTKRNNSARLHATSSVNLFTQQERRFSWKLLFKLRIFNSCCVFKGHLNGPLPFSLHSSDVRKCTIGLNKHLFYLFCSHATIQDESRETAGNCNLAALGILGCFFSCYYKIVERGTMERGSDDDVKEFPNVNFRALVVLCMPIA